MADEAWVGPWTPFGGRSVEVGGPPPTGTRLCLAVKGCGRCSDPHLPASDRCSKIGGDAAARLTYEDLVYLRGIPMCPLDAEVELQRRKQFAKQQREKAETR